MSEISPHPLAMEGEVGPGMGHVILWGQSWGAFVTFSLALLLAALPLPPTYSLLPGHQRLGTKLNTGS